MIVSDRLRTLRTAKGAVNFPVFAKNYPVSLFCGWAFVRRFKQQLTAKEMAPKRRTEPTTASPVAIPIVRLNSATVGSGVVKGKKGKKDRKKKKEKRTPKKKKGRRKKDTHKRRKKDTHKSKGKKDTHKFSYQKNG